MIGDITEYYAEDLPDFDLLTGGFPCQPFSNRGLQHGLDDSQNRGQLYMELVRLLKVKKPTGFMFENVVGLVTMNGGSREQGNIFTPGDTFKQILEAFRLNGEYEVTWKVIN